MGEQEPIHVPAGADWREPPELASNNFTQGRLTMINPTIGRQVWFWRKGSTYTVNQPEAATVVYVHDERSVNLQVINQDGFTRPEINVQLRQPEDPALAEHVIGTSFCEWMPYQVGQATKTGQVEAAAR